MENAFMPIVYLLLGGMVLTIGLLCLMLYRLGVLGWMISDRLHNIEYIVKARLEGFLEVFRKSRKGEE